MNDENKIYKTKQKYRTYRKNICSSIQKIMVAKNNKYEYEMSANILAVIK